MSCNIYFRSLSSDLNFHWCQLRFQHFDVYRLKNQSKIRFKLIELDPLLNIPNLDLYLNTYQCINILRSFELFLFYRKISNKNRNNNENCTVWQNILFARIAHHGEHYLMLFPLLDDGISFGREFTVISDWSKQIF